MCGVSYEGLQTFSCSEQLDTPEARRTLATPTGQESGRKDLSQFTYNRHTTLTKRGGRRAVCWTTREAAWWPTRNRPTSRSPFPPPPPPTSTAPAPGSRVPRPRGHSVADSRDRAFCSMKLSSLFSSFSQENEREGRVTESSLLQTGASTLQQMADHVFVLCISSAVALFLSR